MKLHGKAILCIMVLLMLGTSAFVFGEDLTPSMNNDEKFRIAYFENDPYFNYAGTFYGVVYGLKGAGWIESVEQLPFEIGDDDTKIMYDWLSNEMKSEFIEFPEDAYYQLIDMDERAQAEFIKRLNETDDIDLLLVMGTKAGKFAAKHIVNIPVMVMSTSNAVGAGIVTSTEESGSDNLWAHVDPDRYYRQLSVFYDIFGFSKLGVVYENSPSGRVVAAIDTVETFAEEWGVEIVRYYVDEAIDDADKLRYDRELMLAYNKIAKEVDAFYLTPGSRNTGRLLDYMQAFYDEEIPVFSQVGPLEVSHGALLSVYRFDYDEIGFFGSDRLIRILKGDLAGSLTQKFGETPSVFLNLAVAERINYKIPFNILLISDRIFTEIESDEVN